MASYTGCNRYRQRTVYNHSSVPAPLPFSAPLTAPPPAVTMDPQVAKMLNTIQADLAFLRQQAIVPPTPVVMRDAELYETVRHLQDQLIWLRKELNANRHRYEWASNGRPVCCICGTVGHIARRCRFRHVR